MKGSLMNSSAKLESFDRLLIKINKKRKILLREKQKKQRI